MASGSALESFTWGPQTLWLLAGLFWVFVYEIREIPDVARNTAWIAGGITLAAALGAMFATRRKHRRIALYPQGGRLGFYRGANFQYSFTPADMVLVHKDFFAWAILILKLFVPTVALIGALVFGIVYALKNHELTSLGDALVLAYLLGFGVFVFVAMFRSNVTLKFFWLPDGNGKPNQPAHFSAKELLKLQENPSPIRPLIR
jgi:hypothetical protein